MLRGLSIQNYVLIDRLEMELDPHLNIITGETGAGKSILLGALALLLGGKNDGTANRDQSQSCIIEGTFCLDGYDLEIFFEENDLDYLPETIIRRMITPAGKSRAFINDLPVQLTQLRSLGIRLIDIHSQHQNLIISSPAFRITAIDTIAQSAPLLKEYSQAYTQWRSARKQLEELEIAIQKAEREQEWIRYQVEELTAANLRAGENLELESERMLLANAEQIGETLNQISECFDGEQYGILQGIKEALNSLQRINQSYPTAQEYAERLRSALLELKDLSESIASDSQTIEINPQRLDLVEQRLDLIYTLCQKHRVDDLDALLQLRDDYISQITAIESSGAQIEKLRREVQSAEQKARTLATELHNRRTAATTPFTSSILETLSEVGMVDTQFIVAITPTTELTPTGSDSVEFLFTANRNTSPQSIERVASGGELSRVMLALKVLLASHMKLPTIIFDEIDTGVSGRIADAMGRIINSLGESMQVVNITHLPQVASKGESHFVVYKHQGQTDIMRLTPEQRIEEIAKMLSGSQITDAAIAQAQQLLKE